jgi:hypothetical protein
MQRTPVAILLALGAILVVVVTAVAQSSFQLLPTVVNVNQVVPTTITIAGVVNGQTVTLTAPVNVTVAMQIKLDAANASSTAQTAAQQVAVQAATQTQYDSRNVPYRTDARPPFVLLQVDSNLTGYGDTALIVGEILNNGAQETQFVKAVVTFYKDGKIVSSAEGYTSLDRLASGQSSPFQVLSQLSGDQFNAYAVQVQGRAVR